MVSNSCKSHPCDIIYHDRGCLRNPTPWLNACKELEHVGTIYQQVQDFATTAWLWDHRLNWATKSGPIPHIGMYQENINPNMCRDFARAQSVVAFNPPKPWRKRHQCILQVGDKTLAFWLMDAAMYTDMRHLERVFWYIDVWDRNFPRNWRECSGIQMGFPGIEWIFMDGTLVGSNGDLVWISGTYGIFPSEDGSSVAWHVLTQTKLSFIVVLCGQSLVARGRTEAGCIPSLLPINDKYLQPIT